MTTTVVRPIPANLPGERKTSDCCFCGGTWLPMDRRGCPLFWSWRSFGAVAYVDHLVVSISLVYLYLLPLTVGAIFLRREISYGLIVVCILFHDYLLSAESSHGTPHLPRSFSAVLLRVCCLRAPALYRTAEALSKTVQQQRDRLLKDVELAAQVQRLFLPAGKPAIAGLEIAGMMRPARGVSGDYYDYFPIDAHTTQFVIADVAGKGVPAALLMSATAAAMQLETNRDRNMLERWRRLNTGIDAVSRSRTVRNIAACRTRCTTNAQFTT